MKKMILRGFAAAALMVSMASFAVCADNAYPKKADEYVNDFAGILKNTDKISIAEMLRKVDYDQGAEIQVVCVNSVSDYFPGADAEEFASGIFKEWGVGERDGKGMVLLIAIADRRIAIDLGGAKPGIYDIFMKKVVDGKIVPHFKDGDYSRGIYEGAREISRIIEGRNSIMNSPLVPAAAIAAVIAVLIFAGMKSGVFRRGPGQKPQQNTAEPEKHKPTGPVQTPGFGGGSAGAW